MKERTPSALRSARGKGELHAQIPGACSYTNRQNERRWKAPLKLLLQDRYLTFCWAELWLPRLACRAAGWMLPLAGRGGWDSGTNMEVWYLVICLPWGDRYSGDVGSLGFLHHSLFQFLCQLTACLNLQNWGTIKDFLLPGEQEWEREVKLSVESYQAHPSNCFLQTITCNYLVLFSLDWKLAGMDVFEVKSSS